MMLLPEGFGLPPVPYLVGYLVTLVAVGYALFQRQPSISERHIVGFTPWMAVGSCLHVHYVIGSLPAAVAPLAGTPAVYLTVAALAGGIWLGADLAGSQSERVPAIPAVLFAAGTTLLVPIVTAALWIGADGAGTAVGWSVAALAASLPITAVVWVILRQLNSSVSVTGTVGLLAVFGHVLDGVSTAVGTDVLGFGERTPLSRVIIDISASLPTAELLGAGWLFVVVKAVVAGVVVSLFVEFVEEDPTQGYLLLGVIAAVGLGPGAHNLLLFAVVG